MKAIEFTAKAEDGIIKIPKKYQKELQTKFRVIILHEAPAIKTSPKKNGKQLTALQIKTKGLKFTREEANAR